jgi:hypothetical protein
VSGSSLIFVGLISMKIAKFILAHTAGQSNITIKWVVYLLYIQQVSPSSLAETDYPGSDFHCFIQLLQ